MNKRFFATTLVTLALVFGQGANFFVAALCPHLTARSVSCESSSVFTEMAHHDMDHGAGDSVEQDLTLGGFNTATMVSAPLGDCNHCSMHSRTDLPASPRHLNVSPRSGDPTMCLPILSPVPASTSPPALLAFRAHGPPGTEVSKHILLSIYRI